MRRAHVWLLPVTVLVCAGASGRRFRRGDTTATEIRIGTSLVPLTGPWRFAPGDSPQINGTPKWADPALMTPGWTVMNLNPGAGEIDPGRYGATGYVTGWSARGYPKLQDLRGTG